MSRSKRNRESKPKTKPRSRVFVFCGFLILLAAVVFFLPAILINTPLKQTAIDWATSDLNGTVEIGNVSTGWLSPVELTQSSLKDKDGNEIAAVEKITTSSTLLGLLTGNYGSIVVEKPTLDLTLRTDGSNFEDVIANYLNADNKSSSTSIPALNVKIKNGVIGLNSDLLPGKTVIENFDSDIWLSSQDAALLATVQINGSTGSLVSNVTIDRGNSELVGESIELSVDCDQLSLDSFAPVLTRLLGPSNMAGQVNGSAIITKHNEVYDIDFSKFETTQFAFVAPEILDTDQISSLKSTASGKISTNFTQVVAREFKMESEFARIAADGEFDIDQINSLSAGSEKRHSNFQFDGVVDLAQVASMLPATMRIRDGVQMQSGRLHLTASSRYENGNPRLVFNADAANLNFEVNGREISWNKPLRAVAVASMQQHQMIVEDVRLESDFINISGNATRTSGKLNIKGDLQKVLGQVAQLIDTAGLAVAGVADGQLQWNTRSNTATSKTEPTMPIELIASFNIVNPQFEMPGMKPWREPQMDVAFNAACRLSADNSIHAIESASLEARIGNEQFSGVLSQPISDFQNNSKFQLNCATSGSVAKWLASARNLVEFPQFFCEGNLNSKYVLTVNPQAVRLNQIQFESTDFQFNGFALNIREPKISGRGNLKYDLNTGSVSFTKSRVSSPSFAATTEKLDLQLTDKILAGGILNFRADANRASNWIGFSLPGDSVRWEGVASGTMTFRPGNGRFEGDLAAVIKDMVFVQPVAEANPTSSTNQLVGNQTRYSEVWREPDLNVSSTIALSEDFNDLSLSGLNIRSKTADIRLNGSVQDLANSMRADLQGQWKVQWNAVNQTVNELAGDVIKFQGSKWQPLHIRGPLYSKEAYQWIPNQLAAIANIGWEQASLYNVPLGTNQIDIRIDQSLANMASTASNNLVDRVFSMQPVIDLRRADPILYLQQGKLLDQWAITTDDSRTWLKYAAPLVADATSAEGNVTASIDKAVVPLFDPLESSAAGIIEVHELTVGAGPLVQQLLPMIDQIRNLFQPGRGSIQQQTKWLHLEPQQLPFVIQNGRVYHSNFEMKHKDIVIRTTGSVGFDQSLNLVAEIPILDKWVSGDKTFSRLAGKPISIPIGGTLARPSLDTRAVTQFTSQLIKESAVGVARDKVNQEIGNLNDKVQNELNEFKQKVNGKLKSEIEDKIQGEFQNGLKNLFGGEDK